MMHDGNDPDDLRGLMVDQAEGKPPQQDSPGSLAKRSADTGVASKEGRCVGDLLDAIGAQPLRPRIIESRCLGELFLRQG